MNDPIFEGNETGPYEDPRDNFHYHNYLNPAHQHIAWMHQWKKQHWEIHQACKDLGLTTPTDDYVKGFMDGLSMEPPNLTTLNINRMEDEVDGEVSAFMRSNLGSSIL